MMSFLANQAPISLNASKLAVIMSVQKNTKGKLQKV